MNSATPLPDPEAPPNPEASEASKEAAPDRDDAMAFDATALEPTALDAALFEPLIAKVQAVLRPRRVVETLRHATLHGCGLLWLPVAMLGLHSGGCIATSSNSSASNSWALLFCATIPFALYVTLSLLRSVFDNPTPPEALGWIDAQFQFPDTLRTAYQFSVECSSGATPLTRGFRAAALEPARAILRDLSPSQISAPHESSGATAPHNGPRRWRQPAALAVGVVLMLFCGGLAPMSSRVTGVAPPAAAKSRGDVLPSYRTPSEVESAVASAVREAPLLQGTQQPLSRGMSADSDATPNLDRDDNDSTAAAFSASSPRVDAQSSPPSGSTTGGSSPASSTASPAQDRDGKPGSVAKSKPPRNPATDSTASSSSAAPGAPGTGRSSESATRLSETQSHDLGNSSPHSDNDNPSANDNPQQAQQQGGLSPAISERRPPPSRELSVGRTEEGTPNARGGPSPRKKSRGTASLIMGVPIPDVIPAPLRTGPSQRSVSEVPPPSRGGLPATTPAANVDSPEGAPGAPQWQLSAWQRLLLRRTFDRPEQQEGESQ